MEYGDKVSFTHRLERVTRIEHRESASGRAYKSTVKKWKSIEYPGEGIFLGSRTVANGVRDWEYEVGYIFYPEEHFQVALVSPGPRINPIYVPLDALTAAAGGEL